MQSETLKIKSVYWTSECSDQAAKTWLPFVSPYLHHDDPLLIEEAGLLKAQENNPASGRGRRSGFSSSPQVNVSLWVLSAESCGSVEKWFLVCVLGLIVLCLTGHVLVFLILIFLQVCWRESPLSSGFGWALLGAGGSPHGLTYKVPVHVSEDCHSLLI